MESPHTAPTKTKRDNNKRINDRLGSAPIWIDVDMGERSRRVKSPCSIVERQHITPNTEKSRSGKISTWLRNEGKMLNAAASKTW